MPIRTRLNLYEQGIVKSLVSEFGYREKAARELVVAYIQIVRQLGGYDNCRDHAERLAEAQKTGYSPEKWLARIQTVKREKARDKGLPFEQGPEFAHAK